MARRSCRKALVLLLFLSLSAGSLINGAVLSHEVNQAPIQPSTKRNVYVFFNQFSDVTNSTRPAHFISLLNSINSYYSNVTFGGWQFNWSLFYPALGQPWYTVTETYAQAGNNSDLTPLFKVIDQAYNSGAQFPALPPCCNGIAGSISALIVHAGNSSVITHKTGYDIWPVTSGYHCIGPASQPYCFIGSVVAENEPLGVIMYEMTHQLQQFNMYGQATPVGYPDPVGAVPDGMVAPDPWDLMFGGLYNGNPTGTHPTEYGAFTRVSLGFMPLSQVAVVDKGHSSIISLNDLEEPTSGYQGIRIPIANDTHYDRFYMVELRKGVSSDYYFPWITSEFPNRTGLLIWYIRSSRSGGDINAFLVKAHPWDIGGQTAIFGPETNPKFTTMTMLDAQSDINVTILSTSNSSYRIQVANLGGGTVACPSIFCFLGIINFGSSGFLLNITVVTLAGVSIGILAAKRRRDLSPIPSKPGPLSLPRDNSQKP